MSETVFYHAGGKIVSENYMHEEEPGWYFWDETGAYYLGPYDSRESAQNNLTSYARQLNGEG